MAWEANLIQFLQRDFFNGLLLLITQLGSELFFLVVVVVLYWCRDKRLGYKFFNVYLLGTAVNTGLKALVGRARPFEKYPDSVHSVGTPETSRSFPSGHSHSIANLSTQAALNARRHRVSVIVVGAALTFCVMFSRLYLGQHYLTDVLAGAAVGVGAALGFSALYELLKDKEEWLFLGIVPLCAVLVLTLSLTGHANADVMKVLGAYSAFTLGYFFEKRFVGFRPVSDKPWKYLLKILVGLAVGLGIKEGFKLFLPVDVPMHDFLRYFLVAAWASIGAPVLFKLFRW